MKCEPQTSIGPTLQPVTEPGTKAAGIQAISLPMIAPSQGFRLRNVIIRKPRTFVVEIRLSQ